MVPRAADGFWGRLTAQLQSRTSAPPQRRSARGGQLWAPVGLSKSLETTSGAGLLHHLQNCLLVLGRERDFQFLAAMTGSHLEPKDAKALMVADVKLRQPNQRKVGNDYTELLLLPQPYPRQRFLGYERKLARREQKSPCGRQLTFESAGGSRPTNRRNQVSVVGQIAQGRVAKFRRPAIKQSGSILFLDESAAWRLVDPVQRLVR